MEPPTLLSIEKTAPEEGCFRILTFSCKVRDPQCAVVGQITLLGSRSAMVWFGWGETDDVAPSTSKDMVVTKESIKGKGPLSW